jgi:alpha-galactosidase
VRDYGQLWREGDDMANYSAKSPEMPRFKSVLFNYAYNLPLGRFQKPGNWNDADFIIGGDSGLSLAESRSQMALWAMMSAPLILSSDVGKLSPDAIEILGNPRVIAIDQDPLGKDATLVRRTPTTDVLMKPLKGGDYAVAILNRGDAPLQIHLDPVDLGFRGCTFAAEDLWSGERKSSLALFDSTIAQHDTAIWRVRPEAGCGAPTRTGVITMTTDKPHDSIDGYAHCLAAAPAITVEDCSGGPGKKWSISPLGELVTDNGCLTVDDGKAQPSDCIDRPDQRWRYTLAGNLINESSGLCLTNQTASTTGQPLTLEKCGQNQLNQIWSLPN